MTDTLVNFIHFEADEATLSGNIASLSFDIDISGKKVNSTNPKAPVFKLFAKSLATTTSRSAASGRRPTRKASGFGARIRNFSDAGL